MESSLLPGILPPGWSHLSTPSRCRFTIDLLDEGALALFGDLRCSLQVLGTDRPGEFRARGRNSMPVLRRQHRRKASFAASLNGISIAMQPLRQVFHNLMYVRYPHSDEKQRNPDRFWIPENQKISRQKEVALSKRIKKV